MTAHSPNFSTVPKVTPQVICGPVHLENKTALEWSWQGPIAFGSQQFVVVVDPRTCQNLQTLTGHNSNVTKVRWSRQLFHHTLASPYVLRLASVDTSCQCIIWDVGQATATSNFSIGNKTLVDMQWLTTNDTCRDLLAVLVSPSTMTIWNADTGTKVSRFTFSEIISAFTFNPFQPEQLILLSPDCFIYINEFSPLRNPTGNSKKLYMNLPHQQIGGAGRGQSRDAPRRLLSGDNIKSEDSLTLVDCLQLCFSPTARGHLLLLYSREILIIDIEIMQAVGSVFLERASAPFIQMFPCQQRDALYCLHENGSVSFRVRQPVEFPEYATLSTSDFRQIIDVNYDLHYFSESLRISKSIKPYALTVCPYSELQVAILTSEGRMIFWETSFEKIRVYGERLPEDFSGGQPITLISALPSSSSEEGGGVMGEESRGLTLSQSIAPHWFIPPDGLDTYFILSAYMVLTGVYYGLSSSPTTIRMCPPLTTKNWSFYKPLVAVGNGGGGVQIFNLATRQLYREITVHTCPVRGIEWMHHNVLLTYAYPPTNSSGQVRNELAAVHLETGHVTHLKKNDMNYQQPIISVKISPHKNYFLVNIKDSPPEFWNATTLTFMRILDSKPSSFPVMEWANVSAFPSFVAKIRHVFSPTPDMTGNKIASHLQPQENRLSQWPEKEVVTLADNDGNIHHIIIDDTNFMLGPNKTVHTPLKNISTLAWKSEILVLGDSEGTMMVWEILTSNIKYIDANRAFIRKIKFGPGKGNKRALVLYTNRIDIRDMFDDNVLGYYKWSKNELSIEDVDWCSSDKLICLMSDGTVKVCDIKFNNSSASHSSTDYQEPIFSPQTMLPQSALRLKCILQHQSWNVDYSLDYSNLDRIDPIENGLAQLLKTLPEDFQKELMSSPLGTPQRCLLTAILLGDERETQFWNVALYHMIKEKHRLYDPRYRVYQSSPLPSNPTSDLFQPDSQATTDITGSLRHSLEDLIKVDEIADNGSSNRQNMVALVQEADHKTWFMTPPLDLCHDLFMDQSIYKRYQLHRALCHDGRRHTTSQTRRCAETLLFLGQTDRAVQLLLEADPSSGEYYTDALKACLAATIRSSGASQSTIKLVATNLIANNKLLEGTQLLSLIDKGLDSCRYLQTYGKWYYSVWLAKSTLNDKETKEVFLRWVDHLTSTSVNQKNKALLVLLSLGQFLKVIEMLYSMRYFDLAAVLTESCLEYGLIRRNKETASLVEAVFLEYARTLQTLGMSRAMRYYCNLAGENGRLLLEEHFSPPHDKSS